MGHRIAKRADLESIGQGAQGGCVPGLPGLAKSDNADAKFHESVRSRLCVKLSTVSVSGQNSKANLRPLAPRLAFAAQRL
jgi:hypothetical protein